MSNITGNLVLSTALISLVSMVSLVFLTKLVWIVSSLVFLTIPIVINGIIGILDNTGVKCHHCYPWYNWCQWYQRCCLSIIGNKCIIGVVSAIVTLLPTALCKTEPNLFLSESKNFHTPVGNKLFTISHPISSPNWKVKVNSSWCRCHKKIWSVPKLK